MFLASAVTAVAVLFTGAWIFFIVGPKLETYYWPVITNGYAQRLDSKDDTIRLAIGGTKQRTCRYLESQLSVFDGTDWVPVKVAVGPRYTVSNLPKGQQVFGIYHFEAGWTKIRIEATHRCHALWDSSSKVLEANLDEIPFQR